MFSRRGWAKRTNPGRYASVACSLVVALGCQGHVEPSADSGSDTGETTAVHNTSLASQKGGLGPSDWQLVRDDSYLSFISVKQTDVAEVSTFERFDVHVGSDGVAQATIDLSSVATGFDVRDQRLRDYLFEVGTYPEARIDMNLDMTAATKVPVGDRATLPSTATVTLHGLSSEISVDLVVMRLADARVVVSPQKAIVLHATDFSLDSGIDYLVALAGLESISSAVPVDFMFTLEASAPQAN